MSGGILALFGVAFAAAMADLLIPGEERAGTRQLLHVLTALVVLLLLLRPFLSFLGNAEGFLQGELKWEESESSQIDYERQFADAVANRSAVELKQGLQRLLEETYGIHPEDCSITVVLDEDGGLARISVMLSGMALLQDPSEIEEDLRERFDCEVEVR